MLMAEHLKAELVKFARDSGPNGADPLGPPGEAESQELEEADSEGVDVHLGSGQAAALFGSHVVKGSADLVHRGQAALDPSPVEEGRQAEVDQGHLGTTALFLLNEEVLGFEVHMDHVGGGASADDLDLTSEDR